MMRRLSLILSSSFFLLLLAGCWDIKSLQDVNYFTGLGIDYKDGKYTIYVQQLDFSNVAKSEGGGKGEKPALVWVGQAEGVSFSDAVIKLYQTSQQTVFWGHLSGVILTENVLKHGDLIGLFDSMMRYPEIRYTPWIYGTRSKITDLFTTKPFFNLSPNNSILYSPETNYRQRPNIAPMRISQFIREMREPGESTLLPCLSISSDTWKRDKEPDPKLKVDGILALHNRDFNGWVSDGQVEGIRWMTERSHAVRLTIQEKGSVLATLRTSKPHVKIRVKATNGVPEFEIKVKLNAGIIELWQHEEEERLEKVAAEAIAGQIRSTFETGMKRHADLLNLEHVLYRKNNKAWKELTSNGKHALESIMLGKIDVKVQIIHSGTYKLRRKLTPLSSAPNRLSFQLLKPFD